MNSIQLTPPQERSPGIAEIPPVILPNLQHLYSRRAARLRQLAVAHDMADYLLFAANLVDVQQALLSIAPLPEQLSAGLAQRVGTGQAPLADRRLLAEPYWKDLLRRISDRLYPSANPSTQAVLDQLRDLDEATLETLAHALISGEYDHSGGGQAVFIWAALSLYFTQLAAKLPAAGKAGLGEQRQRCPVCSGIPVASVIMTGSQAGLRYLHCSLCASQWHMVRVKCSNCEQTGQIDYWSLNELKTAIKAESCGDCHTYLKVLYPEHDHEAETLADDLASLPLDAHMQQEGFARSGLNPFLLPG
ncbi:formate dehydrogenase accessory protein FdhE [Pseudomonas sp. 5P_3.1_Bac2]|uniref:formate dehydrogenase accessory protein FdhE n=1 Tax=Pseudomonas sp. 5P_3.1_Bac2 TaxID=2971617 RepID=UPI0021C8E210|nr:formate dehydrogenase accessory protein FdhE [Pseudomonas sp. 5P_3.1_Bac2]MCU1717198.1 formate dehydrogenase accessory protein FdhE [Pseudomonas sp. 5P_3.1_Bac2]